VPISKTLAFLGTLAVAVAISFGVRSIRQQNEQILGELSEIRRLVEQSNPSHDRVALADVTGTFLGRADAPLTMVEFTDLQCPFCREFHARTFERIKKEYIDTGKVRYLSRDFPLDSLHPLAVAAARAARCAGEQAKFWEMRHAILVNNANLVDDIFLTFAQQLELDLAGFKDCLANTSRIDAEWQRDKAAAASAGVVGTPSFVIGVTMAAGLNGVRLSGARPYQVFDNTLSDLLATVGR
jgi:protein-disulfide isomerase